MGQYLHGIVTVCLLAWGFCIPPAWAGPTLDAVKERGFLRCGVQERGLGLSLITEAGEWTGFFVDFCRAVAAASVGKATAVEIEVTDSGNRFDVLGSGAIDVLSSTSTWTMRRDVGLGLNFIAVLYYDGQGFLAHKSLGAESLTEVGAATVCVKGGGTTTEKNLAEYIQAKNPAMEAIVFQSKDSRDGAFLRRRCDLLTTDSLELVEIRAFNVPNPDDYLLLPELISKEPLGPVVRDGDPQWFDIVKWVIYATIAAEEKGVTSANVAAMRGSDDPEVRRLLGVDPGLGESLGLDEAWAARVIEQVGNYGEIFERNLGKDTALGLERGLNALWTEGGLMYAPPLR
jgi:general L-amino acid transport system substrate-binding protein